MQESIINVTCEKCGTPYLIATEEAFIYKCNRCESLYRIKEEDGSYSIEERIEKYNAGKEDPKDINILDQIAQKIQNIDSELKSLQPELKKLFVKKKFKIRRDELVEMKKKLALERISLQIENNGNESAKKLFLINPGEKKINVVKTIYTHTSHDLKESRDIVENVPIEITEIKGGEEEILFNELTDIGKGCLAEFK